MVNVQVVFFKKKSHPQDSLRHRMTSMFQKPEGNQQEACVTHRSRHRYIRIYIHTYIYLYIRTYILYIIRGQVWVDKYQQIKTQYESKGTRDQNKRKKEKNTDTCDKPIEYQAYIPHTYPNCNAECLQSTLTPWFLTGVT